MTNTILFAGGEDLDFTPIGGSYGTTSAANIRIGTTAGTAFRSGFARCALSPAGGTNGSSQVTGAILLRTAAFSASNFWVSARVGFIGLVSASTVAAGAPGLICLRDAGGVMRLRLTATTNNHFDSGLILQKVNAAGTATTLATAISGFSIAPTTPDKVDLQVNYGVSGGVSLYVNGVLLMSYTGDVTTDGQTTLATVDFSSLYATNNTGDSSYWSEVIVATADTRTMSLLTIAPAALGTTAQWTGVVGNVNSTAYDDTIGVDTGTAAQIEQYTTATALPSGVWTVLGIVAAARAVTNTGFPQHLDLGLHIGGTDYWSPDQALTSGMQRIAYDWETNPATSAAWAQSSLASGVIGLSLKSVA